MRAFTFWAMAASAAAVGLGTAMPVRAAAPKISGPFIHDNLAVYFLHGETGGGSGQVPLTLSEALEKGTVHVRETGSVNNLEIENIGTEDVFIQAGDIVKGGQQDRVLMMSMILPGKSGRVPIGSFCVEQGRWARRGHEDVKRFASAAEAMPSREAKLAMRAPAAKPTAGPSADLRADTSARQSEVWTSVANVQKRLSDTLGAPVAAAASSSSLQLSLENEKLKARRSAYIDDLTGKASTGDITGYVFAVNGKINSADQYPSNGLFKKMWPKMLAASATEAIGEARNGAPTTVVPGIAEVEAFLTSALAGSSEEQPLGTIAKQETRNGDKVLYVEARKTDGSWVHRNYLAK